MTSINIASYTQSKTLGQRYSARPIRNQIIEALNSKEPITLNFVGVSATQSFTDELVGQLILERGPSILKLISFQECSPEMKGIITFVIRDRSQQYLESKHAHSPRPIDKDNLAYA